MLTNKQTYKKGDVQAMVLLHSEPVWSTEIFEIFTLNTLVLLQGGGIVEVVCKSYCLMYAAKH